VAASVAIQSWIDPAQYVRYRTQCKDERRNAAREQLSEISDAEVCAAVQTVDDFTGSFCPGVFLILPASVVRSSRCRMGTILIVVLVVLLLGGGGGYYGYSRYGGSGVGGALSLVLIVILGLWFFGGLHINR
jgi:hypothetical protein